MSRIDHLALLPVYAVGLAAVLVLVADLIWPGRRAVLLALGATGPAGALIAALAVPDSRGTFCADGLTLPGGVKVGESCSFVADRASASLIAVFCVLALLVLALSVPVVRAAAVPAGEYTFLLLCSLTGAVVLASARDLLTLIVALETLTLPLYVLTGLRRDSRSADAAATFFVVSVVSTTVTLLGAALLYALTGAVHLDRLSAALAARDELRDLPLTAAAVALVLAGLAFKLAAVPFHAWAPGTYDGAPLPIALYLSTASKLGGVVAIALVAALGVRPYLDTAGVLFAVIAVLTMTIGNLVALRQRRMVRLLAWSSVAQAGYLIAPLGAFATEAGRAHPVAVLTGVLVYSLFYLLINAGVFGAVIAARGASDGGTIEEYRGLARRSPWVGAALVLGLAGLAGLPPGFAGLFAKVAVIRALLDGSAGWLAVVVAVNAVIGLAYYARVAALLYSSQPGAESAGAVGADAALVGRAGADAALVGRAGAVGAVGADAALVGRAGAVGVVAAGGAVDVPLPGAVVRAGTWVALATGVASAGAVVLGFAPQVVFDVSRAIADLWV